jgi:hypothetical protein
MGLRGLFLVYLYLFLLYIKYNTSVSGCRFVFPTVYVENTRKQYDIYYVFLLVRRIPLFGCWGGCYKRDWDANCQTFFIISVNFDFLIWMLFLFEIFSYCTVTLVAKTTVSRSRSGYVYLCKVLDFHGGDWRMPFSGMWRRVVLVWTDLPPKRQFTLEVHGATSRKTAFFRSVSVCNR